MTANAFDPYRTSTAPSQECRFSCNISLQEVVDRQGRPVWIARAILEPWASIEIVFERVCDDPALDMPRRAMESLADCIVREAIVSLRLQRERT